MARQIAIPIQGQVPRVTFFIKTNTKTITETHWAPSISGGLSNILQLAANLAISRFAVCSGDAQMIEIRASQENVYRDSLVDTTVAFLQSAGYPQENVGNDCLYIRMNSGTQYRKILYLGAIPDPVIAGDTYENAAIAGYDVALRRYLSRLCGADAQNFGSWGYLAVSQDPLLAPRVQVLSVDGVFATQTVTVTTAQGHGLLTNDIVRLSRVPGANIQAPVNQLWAVTTLTATTFTLQNFPGFVANFNLGRGGTSQKMIKTFVPYTDFAIEKTAGTRKRGGRTFLPLGRLKRKYTVGY